MSAETRHVVLLDGSHLTRQQVAQIARGDAIIGLAPDQLAKVQRTADFLAEQVKRGEPIYGVTTGFGSNADKLLGAHRARDELPGGNLETNSRTLMEELQHNLVVTHAVCVGKPMSADVVRAMLAIRVNTLMRGHSGIRASTLQALAELLNRGIVPVIPEKGSVGASGDLAPLSHLAIVLLGEGEAFYQGERLSGGEALKRAGLAPVKLSFKEGLALNNGTTQMLAMGVLALDRLERLVATADLAAAMTLDAFAGRSSAFKPEVHALRPHPGQVETAVRRWRTFPTISCRASRPGSRIRGAIHPPRRIVSTSAGTGCRRRNATARRRFMRASCRSRAARSTSRRMRTACAASRRCMVRCVTRWRRRNA